MLSTPLKVLFFRNVTYKLRFSFLQLGSWLRLFASCEVELTIAEMACVSRNIRRTFHVPSGVPVQRSISERDCSHPSCSRVRAHRPDVHFPEYPHDCKQSFALFWSSVSGLSVHPRILVV